MLEHALGELFLHGETKIPPILNLPEELLFSWCHANVECGPSFVARVTPVLEIKASKLDPSKLHPITQRLIDEFGTREDVLHSIALKIEDTGFSVSASTYYALYEEPLRNLTTHHIHTVRRWAKKIIFRMRGKLEEENIAINI